MGKPKRVPGDWVVVIWDGENPSEVARRALWPDADIRAGQVRSDSAKRVTVEASEAWERAMRSR